MEGKEAVLKLGCSCYNLPAIPSVVTGLGVVVKKEAVLKLGWSYLNLVELERLEPAEVLKFGVGKEAVPSLCWSY